MQVLTVAFRAHDAHNHPLIAAPNVADDFPVVESGGTLMLPQDSQYVPVRYRGGAITEQDVFRFHR